MVVKYGTASCKIIVVVIIINSIVRGRVCANVCTTRRGLDEGGGEGARNQNKKNTFGRHTVWAGGHRTSPTPRDEKIIVTTSEKKKFECPADQEKKIRLSGFYRVF